MQIFKVQLIKFHNSFRTGFSTVVSVIFGNRSSLYKPIIPFFVTLQEEIKINKSVEIKIVLVMYFF